MSKKNEYFIKLRNNNLHEIQLLLFMHEILLF
jgi:hypothetical protein